MADLDGDGLDDETGEPVLSNWMDGDGDRVHDTTGQSHEDWAARQSAARRAEQTASRDAGDPGRQNDPRRRADHEYGVGTPDPYFEASEGTFLWGDLSGANAQMANYRQARREGERQAWIDQLDAYAPSADDLWVNYEEEGNIAGPDSSELAGATADEGAISIQRDALRQLQDVADDGLTEADRSRMAIARESVGRDVRASREADQQMLAQRGMSGSGQAVAALMGGQQAGASALSQADSQMQIEAQRRALQAMQAQGSLSGQMRGQSFDEAATRGGAADDFARYQTDYQRAREGRNTDRRNMTRESRRDSRQQSFNNQRDITDRRTNYANTLKDPSEVAAESNERTGGFIGNLVSSF